MSESLRDAIASVVSYTKTIDAIERAVRAWLVSRPITDTQIDAACAVAHERGALIDTLDMKSALEAARGKGDET